MSVYFDEALCKGYCWSDCLCCFCAEYLVDYYYNPLITPSVTFTPGSMSSSVFRVSTISNNIWEGAKSFEVGFDLSSCPNLKSGRPDTIRVNIADDDCE